MNVATEPTIVCSLVDLLLGFLLPAFAMAEDRNGENGVGTAQYSVTVNFMGHKASVCTKQEVGVNYIIIMRRKEFLNSEL
jgi:hypothetical protein